LQPELERLSALFLLDDERIRYIARYRTLSGRCAPTIAK
jgi:hypothetical protein